MSEEVSSIIERAEPLTIRERVEEGVYKEAARWLRNNLPQRVQEVYPVNRASIVEAADIQGDITRVLLLLGENGRLADKRESKLRDILFNGEGDKSPVIDCCGLQERNGVKESIFLGAISTLTFLQILEHADPDNFSKLKVEQVVPSAEEDALNKIDCILDWGEEKPICLVQLKSERNPIAEAIEVHADIAEKRDVLGSSSYEMKTMLKRAREISIEQQRRVKCFIVTVPALDTKAVNHNPFGRISDSSILSEIVSYFKVDAYQSGLIPEMSKS